MALLFMDSFDHYATADLLTKWTANGTFTGVTLTIGATGRRSSNGFRIVTGPNSSGSLVGYLQKTIAGGNATAVLGFAFRTSGAAGSSGWQIAALLDGATTQITLRLNSDLTLSVLRGTGAGTVLGTTSASLSADVYYYIELQVLIHPSAGTVDLHLNGASVLSLTAQNTRNSAIAQWTGITIGQINGVINSNAVTRNHDYDDLYLLDSVGSAPRNTFLGDCRVDALYPTAPGATTGWTPLAGANWDAVNDTAPDGDTTYVSTSTVGAIDTFVTQDAPVAGATIFGVQHCLNLKKMDAGVCTIAPVVRHGSTNYPGADLSPGTTYAYGLQIAATNPGTGAAWVEADFNAAEFGYKRTA